MNESNVTALGTDHFTGWNRLLVERGLSVPRVANLLFTVRALLGFCRDYLKLEVIDPRRVTIPRAPQRLPVVLTAEEQTRYLAAIREDCARGNRYAIRFLAFVLCLRSSGARIGELLGLNQGDLDLQRGEAKILGKGGKERILYFGEDAIEALRRYLASRHHQHESLFASYASGRRWDRSDAQRYFGMYAARAVITKHVSAHTFRRIFCTTLHRNGADLFTIKELAGHADIKTTIQYYIAPDKTHLRSQRDKYLRF